VGVDRIAGGVTFPRPCPSVSVRAPSAVIASATPAEPVIGTKKAWPRGAVPRPVIASGTPAEPVIGNKKASCLAR